jgi:serine/threonine kinase 32
MPCLHAISSALEEDPAKRMGSASFHSFTDNPFFRPIDFEALERKEIEPVFVPSSEKTNFDATYDLEELLLEEAPLEARARRQKPREPLKEDASEKEIREDDLYKMIETQFTPFDYTTAAYERSTPFPIAHPLTLIRLARYAGALNPNSSNTGSPTDWTQPPPMTPSQNPSEGSGARSIGGRSTSRKRKNTTQPPSLSGSPPIPANQPPLPNGQSSSPQPGSYRQASSSHSVQAKTPLSPYQPSYNRQQRPTGTRKESTSGGMQVTLDEMGSWSELAKQDATLPADAKLEAAAKPSGGMLSFLARKKGRGHSPKPQERGILGKEGARVVISSGE